VGFKDFFATNAETIKHEYVSKTENIPTKTLLKIAKLIIHTGKPAIKPVANIFPGIKSFSIFSGYKGLG